MRRSLRWTLIGWYGLVLAAVIAAFGATLNLRMRQALFARVDALLESRANALSAALERDVFKGWELELDERYLAFLTASGWFEIKTADGKTIASGGDVAPSAAEPTLGIANQGDLREFTLAGPRDTRVRVGQSVAPERAELEKLFAFTLALGLAVLALALVGGWWLATKTLRPIALMSEAAGRISERDLSQRMDGDSVPTELRELAGTLNATFERLEQAFARQARFTADASHELRTPLSIVRAQAELALRRDRTGAEYRAALEACLRSAARMSRIVEQLLTLARADSGELEIAHADVRLDALVGEVTDEARSESAAAGIDLCCKTAPVGVRGDAVLLAEVVSNLVSNAIRYNKSGGHIDVAVFQQNGSAVLRVADDGDGIPAEALPHLFDRFFRVDPARSRERGGSGLGLAITRSIVEAHGGVIAAESRLGEGSTFTVTLPARSTDASGPGKPPREASR